MIRITLKTLATVSLFVLCIVANAQDDDTEKPPAAAAEEWTPAKIAAEIEATMKRFDRIEYTAETKSTVNTNAYHTDRDPVLVSGTGKYLYRSDGVRWFVDEDAFTYTQGESTVRPLKNVAGFDGQLHYSVDRFGTTNLGEEDLSNSRLEPRAVFWRAAKTHKWLLSALRRDTAEVKSDPTDSASQRRVVKVVSEWGEKDSEWRFEFDFLPERSWMPLSTKIHYAGELAATETLKDFQQTDKGLWYPKQIQWTQTPGPYVSRLNKTIRVTSLVLKDKFSDQEFEHKLPLNKAVVDHRRGISWHNDPWWPELAPWLKSKLNHPAPDFSALRDFRSYADERIDGQPAPVIQAAEWIVGEDPGPWSDKEGKPTILFFFGGRAISPTPRQLVVLKTLAERYRESGLTDAGLNVVGVTAATKTPTQIRQAIRELQVNFPVAIDTANEDGRGYGRTFQAFGLKAYVGLFVIDSSGQVHVVERENVPEGSDLSALEHVLSTLQKGAIQIDSWKRKTLNRREYERAEDEWKRLALQKSGNSRIVGRIEVTAGDRDVFTADAAASGSKNGVSADIQATPILQLLAGSALTTHSFIDRGRQQIIESAKDGTFEITGLRLGTYRVAVSAPGMARTEMTVTLADDDSTAEVNVLLNQADEITGNVIDADGSPIAGAIISATKRHFDATDISRETNGHLAPKLTTDDSGRFEYENLFVGAYTFRVVADGYESAELKHVPSGKQDIKIVLRKPGESPE